MKCPSCGYENSKDARYCGLCQTSFVREPSVPYGLAPGLESRKGAIQKVLGGQATGESWFQRHLNWTWFLAQLAVGLIAYFVVTIFVSSLFVSSTALPSVLPSVGSLLASISVMQIIVLVLQLVAMFGVGAWVLIRKNRSLAWLLIFFVPLVGWIIFLCLENRSELPFLPVSSGSVGSLESSRSIPPGLAPQNVGSASDKYWW
jgi:hypothetical protein